MRKTLVALLGAAISVALQATVWQPPTTAAAQLTVQRILNDIPGPKRVVTSGDQLFLLSKKQHSIVVLDSDLRRIQRIGMIGNGPGELMDPEDMDVFEGQIAVADTRNERIQIFSTDGKFVSQFKVRWPLSVAFLSKDLLAVVTRDVPLMRVYKVTGEMVTAVEDAPDVGAITRTQVVSFTRGRVYRTERGQALFVFTRLPDPIVRWYSPNTGKKDFELRINSPSLSETIAQSRERMQTSIEKRGNGTRSTLNALAIDPKTSELWVAPATSVLFRFPAGATPKDSEKKEYQLRDSSGTSFGAHDIAVAPSGKIYLISGPYCLRIDGAR